MGRQTVVLALSAAHDSRLARDLAAGGVFVHNCELAINEHCELAVQAGASELRLAARVVYIDGQGGAGLELVGFDVIMKAQLAAFTATPPVLMADDLDDSVTLQIDAPPLEDPSVYDDDDVPTTRAQALMPADDMPADDAPTAGDDDETTSFDPATQERRRLALNVNERLRGLTLAEQVRKANSGDPSERITLERMYGKNVWEALLRNPRLTSPEVARIARMGALPRPMIEMIVNNGGWLQIPEVRRALLANTRLTVDQIARVLRLLPKHELKLAAAQTAYPHAVRDAAKRLVRGNS